MVLRRKSDTQKVVREMVETNKQKAVTHTSLTAVMQTDLSLSYPRYSLPHSLFNTSSLLLFYLVSASIRKYTLTLTHSVDSLKNAKWDMVQTSVYKNSQRKEVREAIERKETLNKEYIITHITDTSHGEVTTGENLR